MEQEIKESIIIGLEMLKDGASDKSLIALYNKKIDWLKSLRPQSHWKPSDEQMEALDFAIDCIVPDEFSIKRKVLKELFEQLKAL